MLPSLDLAAQHHLTLPLKERPIRITRGQESSLINTHQQCIGSALFMCRYFEVDINLLSLGICDLTRNQRAELA